MEEHLYEQVVLEIHRGEKRDGLWAKALTNSGGSEVKARSLYIKYRVQSIKDEAEIYNAFAEEAKESAAIEYQRRIALCIKALDTNGYQFIETKTHEMGSGLAIKHP